VRIAASQVKLYTADKARCAMTYRRDAQNRVRQGPGTEGILRAAIESGWFDTQEQYKHHQQYRRTIARQSSPARMWPLVHALRKRG